MALQPTLEVVSHNFGEFFLLEMRSEALCRFEGKGPLRVVQGRWTLQQHCEHGT